MTAERLVANEKAGLTSIPTVVAIEMKFGEHIKNTHKNDLNCFKASRLLVPLIPDVCWQCCISHFS